MLTSGAPDAVTYWAGYSFQITATGIPAPRVGIDGDLPPGLLVDENTGELRGTTYQIGDYPITVTADNGWGRASADYTLHVTGTAPAILDRRWR